MEKQLYRVPAEFMVWAESPGEAQEFVRDLLDDVSKERADDPTVAGSWDATEVLEPDVLPLED